MKNKEEKTKGLVDILLAIIKSTIESLVEMKEFSGFPPTLMTEVIFEFLIFNLHQFNRTFFVWFGEAERNELMDGVVDKVHNHLLQHSDKALRKDSVNLTIDTFGDYLKTEHVHSMTKNFISLYSKREAEYSQYKDEPEKGKGYAGTLLWEFSNKIANMIGKEKDVSLIMKIQQLGIGFTYFADAIKQIVVENGKNN